MRVLIFLLLSCSSMYAQEVRYFSPFFHSMLTSETDYVRTYTQQGDVILVEGKVKGQLHHKARVKGLQEPEQINDYLFYALHSGRLFYYRPFFDRASMQLQDYAQGAPLHEIMLEGAVLRFGQAWNAEGIPQLKKGEGQLAYFSEELQETIHETFKDSLLVMQLGIRVQKRDTIYYTPGAIAMPAHGYEAFYQDFSSRLKYPGMARFLGIEGRVYIAFVVDKEGKLKDFRPLAGNGPGFKKRVMKKLSQMPGWQPAYHEGNPVQMQFILPVQFKLVDP